MTDAEPPDQTPIVTGPFGLILSDKDPFDWQFFMQIGKTPTDDQLALAEAIFDLSEKVRGFRADDNALRMRKGLEDLFAATLVQDFTGDLKRYLAQVSTREKDFFRTIVTPMHRQQLKDPVGWAVLGLVVILLALFVGGEILPTTLVTNLRPYALVCAGVLLGRLVYYGTVWGEVVTTLENYELIAAMAASSKLSILFDLVLGIAACVAFTSGMIVIAIGEVDGDKSGISTAMIADKAALAFVFGMIIGIAKTDFVTRLRRVATQSVG